MKTRVLVLFSFLLSVPAFGVTTLKQVQFSGGDQIDLLFDGKVTKTQVRTEFFNDIVQLSLTDVSVYPAKISSVNGNHISKIFAYQYAPKLVRCRLTIKGNADSFKDQIQVNASGKMLSIRFGAEKSDQLRVHAAQAASAPASSGSDAEEKALLEKVMKSSAGEAPQPAHGPAASSTAPAASSLVSKHESLAGGKPLASPYMAFVKMLFVVGLFGLFAMGLKKFLQGKWAQSGTMGAVNRFARRNFGKKGKMIEVVSTQYLGPKKSIVVVKIAGRLLVLGTANDSINLITQLPSGAQLSELDLDLGDEEGMDELAPAPVKGSSVAAGAGATAAGRAVFADLLDGESAKPAVTPSSDIRARIKSKIEGMKPL